MTALRNNQPNSWAQPMRIVTAPAYVVDCLEPLPKVRKGVRIRQVVYQHDTCMGAIRFVGAPTLGAGEVPGRDALYRQ